MKLVKTMLQKCVWKILRNLCFICAFLYIFTQVNSLDIECHDDPSYLPADGPIQEIQFTWLGILQYIHIKNGTPHYFRAPRVVLVTKQFVLSMAHDAALVPKGYALGNIVFGEYERDEDECGVTVDEIAGGAKCESAELIVPIADVIVHPHYMRDGQAHSVALMKLLRPVASRYMLPVCLPLSNCLEKRGDQERSCNQTLYHVDYPYSVPRMLSDEVKEIYELQVQPDDTCNPMQMYNAGDEQIKKGTEFCSNMCDLNSGAPTVIQETTGHWTVVALSLGGSQCPDPLQMSRRLLPPRHLLVHPYLRWITEVVARKKAFTHQLDSTKNNPFGQMVPRVTNQQRIKAGWVGHWWMGGMHCFDRGPFTVGYFRFYDELFVINPFDSTNLTYYIEFAAPPDVKIMCVKVGMPVQLAKPQVWALETAETKVRIPIRNVTYSMRFEVEAWGINTKDYPLRF